MAKAKQPAEEVILLGLKAAIDALPNLLPLTGTKGKALFATADKDIAEHAVAVGYLTKREGAAPSGKGKSKAAPPTFGLLTVAGAMKVASVTGSQALKETLELLRSAVEKIGKPASPPDAATIVAAIQSSTTSCVNAINAAFTELRTDVLRAVAPSGGSAIDPAPILAAITTALGKVEPTVVRIPVVNDPKPSGPSPTTDPVKPDLSKLVTDEIVSFVNKASGGTGTGCDFGELFDYLERRHPALSIGAFQDVLRTLSKDGRIRLGGWAEPQDEIPRPELAFFVSSKVMYYVHPAS